MPITTSTSGDHHDSKEGVAKLLQQHADQLQQMNIASMPDELLMNRMQEEPATPAADSLGAAGGLPFLDTSGVAFEGFALIFKVHIPRLLLDQINALPSLGLALEVLVSQIAKLAGPVVGPVLKPALKQLMMVWWSIVNRVANSRGVDFRAPWVSPLAWIPEGCDHSG